MSYDVAAAMTRLVERMRQSPHRLTDVVGALLDAAQAELVAAHASGIVSGLERGETRGLQIALSIARIGRDPEVVALIERRIAERVEVST
jgi:hypothetical protein